MAREFRLLAAPAIRRVEAGVISGAGGLIRLVMRPHPKPTPDGSQGVTRARVREEWPGAAHVEAVGTYSRSQSDVRSRNLDGPSTTSQ